MERINPQRILDVGSSTHRVELPGVDKAHSVAARTLKRGSFQHRLYETFLVRHWVQVSSEDDNLIFLNINSLVKRTTIIRAETEQSDFPRIFLDYANGAASLHKALGEARIWGSAKQGDVRVVISEKRLGKGTFKTVMLGAVMMREGTTPKALQYFHSLKDRSDFMKENQIAALFKDSPHLLNPSEEKAGIWVADLYPLSWKEIDFNQRRKAILDVAKGIKYMHGRGYAHSDIKPDNFLFRRTDEGVEGVVADFGGVLELGSRARVVTQHYLPQIWDGRVSAASDLYAFGVSLMEMFPDGDAVRSLGVLVCSGTISDLDSLITQLEQLQSTPPQS